MCVCRYQFCTEMFMPQLRNGVTDMFYPQPWNTTLQVTQCMQQFGVYTDTTWAQTIYGGRLLQYASNIVFSNGKLDPWSGTGVLQSLSPSVVTLMIDDAAHHLDLFFSHPGDPLSVIEARETERKNMSLWIQQYWAMKGKGFQSKL